MWDELQQHCLLRLALFKLLGRPATPAGQPSPLTATEKDILLLMAQGNQNMMIAEVLDLPPRRVSKCISDILVRLDARNRAHAVSIAIRQGIITLPEDTNERR